MKKTILVFVFALACTTLITKPVSAAAANVYISPSSSTLNKGDNVTVSVRINSGGDTFDTAGARINYDSSKLQYVSYSAGAMTTVATSSSSSSFKYEGFVLPPFISGDKSLFSITFKSIESGTANLSLSEVQVLSSGNAMSITTGSGSVTINDTSSGGGTSGGGSSTTKKPTTSSPPTTTSGDKIAPALSAEPLFDKTQADITMKYSVNEAAIAKLTYYRDGVDKKSLEISEAKTDHEFIIGKDDPLTPGFTYKLELILTDTAGNSTSTFAWDVRTDGVQYKVRIIDSNGKPISNMLVQLFSDPVTASTDGDGYALFNDIPVGEHTLAFEIEGVTVQKSVNISVPDKSQDGIEQAETIMMPFTVGTTSIPEKQKSLLPWLLVAFVGGMVVMKLPLLPIAQKIRSRFSNKTLPPNV